MPKNNRRIRSPRANVAFILPHGAALYLRRLLFVVAVTRGVRHSRCASLLAHHLAHAATEKAAQQIFDAHRFAAGDVLVAVSFFDPAPVKATDIGTGRFGLHNFDQSAWAGQPSVIPAVVLAKRRE